MSEDALVVNSSKGLYCPQGDFYIDPWRSVNRAVITHAHSDHARSGSKSYLSSIDGQHVLRSRLGKSASIRTLAYGEQISMGSVKVSLHPAGHVLGSVQVRIEDRGRVWVASGDYKTRPDPTCLPFEPVNCNCFITESTFGLPVYRWPNPENVALELNQWWQENSSAGRISLVLAYSFGKAQRILSMLDPGIGSIYVHPSVDTINRQYIFSGVKLPACGVLSEIPQQANFAAKLFAGAMIIAAPSALTSQWISNLSECCSTAFASGWMRIRANRMRNSFDRGFIVSDHADWDELLEAISQTGAEEIIVTHGYIDPLIAHLKEKGLKARSFKTRFHGETEAELSDDEKPASKVQL